MSQEIVTTTTETVEIAPDQPATQEEPKPKSPKKPGVVQFIIDTHTTAYPDGLENSVAEQLLAQQFPDRDPKSMANTLKLQPHYLRKNRGLNVIPGIKGGWCIVPAGVAAPIPTEPPTSPEPAATEPAAVCLQDTTAEGNEPVKKNTEKLPE